MIEIDSLGKNQTIVIRGSTVILVSYQTPVAACVGGIFYRTSEFWSVTTSRHINQWLRSNAQQPNLVEEKVQSYFDALLED